jgi:hypothetical protein
MKIGKTFGAKNFVVSFHACPARINQLFCFIASTKKGLLHCEQGDQIGRIFAHWVIVLGSFGQFWAVLGSVLKIEEAAQISPR